MNFFQFLTILRMRRYIILVTILLTALTTLLVSFLTPPSYKATATLVLNYKGTDPISGMVLPAQLLPGYMSTQVDIMTSKSVALKVVDELHAAEDETMKRDFLKDTGGKGNIREWIASSLLKNLDVTPGRESSILEVNYKDSNPENAAKVANAFANGYQQISTQIKLEPIKQASIYLNTQIKVLHDNLKAAQKKLSQYQQANGIINIDNRLDIETTRLNELSAQLVIAQGQRMEALSRHNHGANDSPDVISNPLVQRLKEELANAESKLSETSEKFGTNHPQYIGAKAEAAKLRTSLNEQIKSTLNSVSSNAQIFQQREAEIKAAVAAQKAKVLELNKTRDEQVITLNKEVESAQHAYDAATTRFNQTSLEGQSNQSDIALISPASPPTAATGPKTVQNVILSILLGSLLGLGFGLLAEMIDRPIRSTEDLASALQAPVLGNIEWKAGHRHKRLSYAFLSKHLRAN
jgi:polysaccharide biosynthesis transport protein